jgi:hypothetical protein
MLGSFLWERAPAAINGFMTGQLWPEHRDRPIGIYTLFGEFVIRELT